MKIPDLRWPVTPGPYDDDLLLEVMSGTAVLLIRGRNAWHSTWVRNYLNNSTLYTDVWSAKMGAEEKRGRGNVFYVVEVPALLLVGSGSHVVLCDAHPNNSFGAFKGLKTTANESVHGSWINGVFPGVSVRDAVSAFHHNSGHWSGPTPSKHSLRSGVLDSADGFELKARPMKSFVSRAVGTDYYLEWDQVSGRSQYTRRGANRVAREWADAVAEAVPADKVLSLRARDLQAYRRDVLKAMPRSQWLLEVEEKDRKRRELKDAASTNLEAARDRLAELQDAQWDAESEHEDAVSDRLRPASTSTGLRDQRERLERAIANLTRLATEIEVAEREVDRLRGLFRQV